MLSLLQWFNMAYHLFKVRGALTLCSSLWVYALLVPNMRLVNDALNLNIETESQIHCYWLQIFLGIPQHEKYHSISFTMFTTEREACTLEEKPSRNVTTWHILMYPSLPVTEWKTFYFCTALWKEVFYTCMIAVLSTSSLFFLFPKRLYFSFLKSIAASKCSYPPS